jgi:zinc/manganese transport system permease protein
MTTDLQVVWEVMKWPFVACLLFPPLLVYLGLHVVKREVIFVDLAFAALAELGTCVVFIMGCMFDYKISL